jgi:23S rRNA pseudouridine1911/1915/1917 synthase
MQTFIVREKHTTLFEYLEKELHGIKRTTLKNYLRHQAVFVNGTPISRHDHPLKSGDKVTVERDKQKAEANRYRSHLEIIHEDDALLVIEKPPGLLTISTEKVKTNTAFYQAHEYLKMYQALQHPKNRKPRELPSKMLFIVHRLDRDASGLLVLAKTPDAKYFLQENWAEFEKKYYAVVEGTLAKPSGEISSYLKENKILRVISSKEELPDSKHAVSQYKVLKVAGPRSLVEVTLKTGRKHQIRVHLASIGHPILGDKDYGNASLSKRLALHAYHLSIVHPVTKKRMTFQSKLPQEIERLLKP